MKLLFAHGWGFDAAFWSRMAALLPPWEQVRDDRGYFGKPAPPDIDAPCIAVTHSFGTMRVLAGPPPQLAGIVAICGFDRFTQGSDYPGMALRVVNRMISAFDRHPDAVLADFRTRCGADGPSPEFDPERLREDLILMRDEDLRQRTAELKIPVLSLQAANDRILPAETRQAALSGAAQFERREHPAAGHLLPMEDARWCADAVQTFAGRLS